MHRAKYRYIFAIASLPAFLYLRASLIKFSLKKVVIILVFVYSLINIHSSFAQWVVQNNGIKNVALESVYFTDSLHGWAVGQGALIIKTTNGGKTWVKENSSTSDTSDNYFTSVFFTDVNHGWIVGGYISYDLQTQEILKYENNKWVTQVNISGGYLNSVYFTDINHGWAVGVGGEIWKYNGKQWETQESGTLNDLNSVYMKDSITGWAVGNLGTILKYDGKEWKLQHSGGFGNLYPYLFSVYFPDSTEGWAVGIVYGIGEIILKYENKQWTQEESGTIENLSSVYFTDINNGWAVGGEGAILKYDGKQWKAQNSGTTSNIISVCFTDSNNGWAVGYDIILHTNNGGCMSSIGDSTANACDSFTWNDSTYTSTPTIAPTKVLTNKAGCDSTVTLNLTINYSNTSDTIATACNSFTWNDSTYTSTPTIAPTKVLTNKAGCDSTVTLNLTIEICTGINENTNIFQVLVYPNPLEQLSVISYQLSVKSVVNIGVYDLMGNEVCIIENGELRMENVEYKINFDAGKLNNGVYFCRMVAGESSVTKKIVIVH